MSAIIMNMNVIPNEVEIVPMEFEFDHGELEKHWDHISQNSFAAESCFFNCQYGDNKEAVLDYLDEVESAMTDYTQCVFEWLQTVKFVEKSRTVPPLPSGAFCNDSPNNDSYVSLSHPVNRVTHSNVVAQIQQFESSQNLADLIGLRYKVEVMKECVRFYVESNRKNTEKYILDEHDPDYTSYPAWMFFPLVFH